MRRPTNDRARLGRILKEPDFKDLAAFWDGIDALPLVEKVPATHNGEPIPGAYWLSDVGGKPNALVSDVYGEVQHKEAFLPILEGIRDTGLPFTATLDAIPSKYGGLAGKVRATVLFESPDFRVKLRTGEQLAVGVRIENGMDGKTGLSIGGETFNLTCANGNALRTWLGMVHVKHVGNAGEVVQQFEAFTRQMLDRATMLPGILDLSSTLPVKPRDIVPLLVGAGVAHRVAKDVDERFASLLVDEQARGPLTVKQAFDALTYYGTHVYDKSWESQQQLMEAANVLLTNPADSIQAGRVKVEQIEARKRVEVAAVAQ